MKTFKGVYMKKLKYKIYNFELFEKKKKIVILSCKEKCQ